MDEVVALSVSRQKFNMWLMSVFGDCAQLLAAIGIYGLMAYSVEQRTQEIGIRLALGAQAAQVRRMVVRQGMVLALVGRGHRPWCRVRPGGSSSPRSSSASRRPIHSSSPASPLR
jgi:hypothetical protein